MRTRLYHHTAPKGEIFTDQEAHDKALKKGWHPAPWLAVEPEKKMDTSVRLDVALPERKGLASGPSVNELLKEKAPGPQWPEKKEIKHCACGCGTPVTGTWVKGHQFRGREDGDKKDDQQAG